MGNPVNESSPGPALSGEYPLTDAQLCILHLLSSVGGSRT
jgi:hypothetical protein